MCASQYWKLHVWRTALISVRNSDPIGYSKPHSVSQHHPATSSVKKVGKEHKVALFQETTANFPQRVLKITILPLTSPKIGGGFPAPKCVFMKNIFRHVEIHGSRLLLPCPSPVTARRRQQHWTLNLTHSLTNTGRDQGHGYQVQASTAGTNDHQINQSINQSGIFRVAEVIQTTARSTSERG